MFSYIYVAWLAEGGGGGGGGGERTVSKTRKASDTVCIMVKIFHVCIMVQRAWKARLK